jgi:hypothetical protein
MDLLIGFAVASFAAAGLVIFLFRERGPLLAISEPLQPTEGSST